MRNDASISFVAAAAEGLRRSERNGGIGLETNVKIVQQEPTRFAQGETLKAVIVGGRQTHGPAKHMVGRRITAIKICFFVQLALFVAAGCTEEPIDPTLRGYLGPLPGVAYVYDAGDVLITLTGLEQLDANTLHIEETYSVPAELVAQGFPTHSERVYVLHVEGAKLVETSQAQETVLLDTASPSWEMPFETMKVDKPMSIPPNLLEEQGDWEVGSGQCRVSSHENKMLWGRNRQVVVVSCLPREADGLELRRFFAEGIGLYEQGFFVDGEYLQSMQLIDMKRP